MRLSIIHLLPLKRRARFETNLVYSLSTNNDLKCALIKCRASLCQSKISQLFAMSPSNPDVWRSATVALQVHSSSTIHCLISDRAFDKRNSKKEWISVDEWRHRLNQLLTKYSLNNTYNKYIQSNLDCTDLQPSVKRYQAARK